MNDRDDFIVNEEEQNIPVNPRDEDLPLADQNESTGKENKETRKDIPAKTRDEKQQIPQKGNMDESEGFDPNIVPPV